MLNHQKAHARQARRPCLCCKTAWWFTYPKKSAMLLCLRTRGIRVWAVSGVETKELWMLSVREMRERLTLLQAVAEQGDPVQLCRIQMRQMPLVTAGEDASEYIPFAIHPDMAAQSALFVRRLRDLMMQYMVEGVTVSAHTLPQQNTQSRAMMQALRATQPHLPSHFLHHWCTASQGAMLLRSPLHANWKKAWTSPLDTSKPSLSAVDLRLQWLAAVNILILRMIREEIRQLPDGHGDMLDSILVHVLGASYHWLLCEFAEQHIEGLSDAERGRLIQTLAVSVPALTFFRRQPKRDIFSDAPHMLTAYGLETELLPRMRHIFCESPQATAADVLAELATESLSDHLLKRSWARLALRDMGEKSGQGLWLKWAMDAKQLDKLLNAPEKVAAEFSGVLQAMDEHPLAVWLLAHSETGLFGQSAAKTTPWRDDETPVQVFLLFEQDADIESERRMAEQRWLNRESSLVGEGRGSEAGRILGEAHAEGKIVLLQKDAQSPLFVGGGAPALQGCLRVDWSEYLRIAALRRGGDIGTFLTQVFQPGVSQLLHAREGVFVDAYSASGLLLRGEIPALLTAGMVLREALAKWLQDLDVTGDIAAADEAVVGMCLAVRGDWSMAQKQDVQLAGKLAFSPGLAQAESAVGRNDGLQRLFSRIDAQHGRQALGDVRIESLATVDGKSVPVLYNRGFIITGSAVQGLVPFAKRLRMRKFRASAEQMQQKLSAYRWPGGKLEGISLYAAAAPSGDAELLLLLHVGKVLLGAGVEDIFELMDPQNPAYALIADALSAWQGAG
ncbi:MAG: hypothetical protein Q9M25_09045 [Mariprofundaceae bacterium]|nr:hypothetical protein [Mariprofundaceae bacterium]